MSEITLLKWEENCIKEHGFYIHVLQDDPNLPTGFNAHTHGLTDSFKHPDLQITMPLPQQAVGAIFHEIVSKIRKGWKCASHEIYENILGGGYKLSTRWAKESDRTVIRLIMPDKTGELEFNKMLPGPFKDQFHGIIDSH